MAHSAEMRLRIKKLAAGELGGAESEALAQEIMSDPQLARHYSEEKLELERAARRQAHAARERNAAAAPRPDPESIFSDDEPAASPSPTVAASPEVAACCERGPLFLWETTSPPVAFLIGLALGLALALLFFPASLARLAELGGWLF